MLSMLSAHHKTFLPFTAVHGWVADLAHDPALGVRICRQDMSSKELPLPFRASDPVLLSLLAGRPCQEHIA